jgi:hypothetical protein
MAGDRITAPFTAAQVDALNRFQHYGFVHPFTCPNEHEGDRALVATWHGWICPHCKYTQDWAHKLMLYKMDNPLPDRRDVFIEHVARALNDPGELNPRRVLENLVASAKEFRP